jgi:sortase A
VNVTRVLIRYVPKRVIEIGLFCAGGTLLALYAGARIESKVFNAYQDFRLEERRRQNQNNKDPAVAKPLPAEGDVIGRLEIARLGIRAAVVEGISPSILRKAVGHVPQTALPDESGNLVIAGHRDTFFSELWDIRPGDRMVLATPEGDHEYVVERTRITEPEDMAALRDDGGAKLTLITCYPFRYIGPAPMRFIVQGRRRSS